MLQRGELRASQAWLIRNPRVADRKTYPFADVLSLSQAQIALNSISQCPLYGLTPLEPLADIAAAAGVEAVFYKDEASRMGLGSFKALGGAYAVALELSRRVAAAIGRPVSPRELATGEHAGATAGLTVVCASDGNHGRSVAAGAKAFGCACAIYLHEGVSEGRADAIRAQGARVVRVAGNYDDSVRVVCGDAAAQGWILVADTATEGQASLAATVMQGYSVMVAEALRQLADHGPAPLTHVFLQGGVGGMAAAVVAHLWEQLGAAAPVVVVVEPDRADCLFRSAAAGRPQVVEGELDTVMAGLACGEVSSVAWPILDAGANFFMTVADEDAVAGMRRLADRDRPIVAGESATAGLAGLLAVAATPESASLVGLSPDSRVLLIGTEGATDPDLYARLVGRSAEAVASGRGAT